MRVFLRSKKTHLYCAISSKWAAGTAQAFSFTNVSQAAKFGFDEKVPEAEIVVRYDLLEEEVALPLVAEWCQLRCLGDAGERKRFPAMSAHPADVGGGISGSLA
jgi:hypothetical protein